jgi:uncharacterized protein
MYNLPDETRWKELFPSPLALIAVVHTDPLPGSPEWRGDLDAITQKAVREARRYEKYGADAIIIENLGDYPYFLKTQEPETVAAMTVVAQEVKRAITKPLGIQILRNSWKSALAVASVVGASFIRLNILTDALVTDSGVVEGEAPFVQRYRRMIGAQDVRIFADLYSKHGAPLARSPLGVVARDMAYRAGADAIIMSGDDSWSPPDRADIEEVAAAVPNTPIIIGSGLAGATYDLLDAVNGFIYGAAALIPGATRATPREDPLCPVWMPEEGDIPDLLRDFDARARAAKSGR